jgi:AmmeMemoRadiSam system protein A
MAASQSSSLEPRARALLLATAAQAIESRFTRAAAAAPEENLLPGALRVPRASFVTLTLDGALRGCCGSLHAHRPLALDVWANAQASAFGDPRFEPLKQREWARIHLEVSVLSSLERMFVRDEADLRARLAPGTDGLVLVWRGMRATFLPKVWEHLREPAEFLAHLKRKAGWHEEFWATDLEVWRYTTEAFADERPATRNEAIGG